MKKAKRKITAKSMNLPQELTKKTHLKVYIFKN